MERLLRSLNRLVDAGHTVMLIEHHMDVIKTADHVIDLGPEGGHAGGRVVVTGTPEEVAGAKRRTRGDFSRCTCAASVAGRSTVYLMARLSVCSSIGFSA